MPNFNQQAEKGYKKLQNLATTGQAGTANARFTFNEPFAGPLAINPQQIWVEQHLIPNTAPAGMTNGQIVGVVQRFINLRLKSVAGTTNSFYHESLKDCLPHVYGDQASYNIGLKDGSGAAIVFGQGDWEIDYEAGVLTFFGTVPSGVGTNYPTNTPQISFYRYVGPKGSSVLYLSQTELQSTSGTSGFDNYNFAAPLTKYTSNAIYILKPTHANNGPVYVNINDLGPKQVMKVNESALAPLAVDDIEMGINYILIYDKYNDIFQMFSGIGGSGGGGSASSMLVDLIAPGSVNYEVLGFKEIGSVQFYERHGNNFVLVNADISIHHVQKTITVNTISTVDGILRIVGRGDVITQGTSGSSAPFLDDLVDVAITNIQVGESIVWNGTSWINGLTTPTVTVNTNFSTILNNLTNNTLTPGALYRFAHQTKHVIPNTGDINIGTTEYFYAEALSPSLLSKVIYSESNPQDIVYFDFNDIMCENGTSGREGKITYRKDPVRNLSTYYDFRNVKYRRWFNNARSSYADTTNTGGSSFDYYTFTQLTPNVNNIEIKPYIIYDNFSSSYKPVYNNIIVGGNFSSNNIFEENCRDIILTDYCENNVFGPGCFDITLTGSGSNETSNNSFGSKSSTITLNEASKNAFGNGCNNILLKQGSDSNVFLNTCSYITLNNGCYKNTFGNGCFNISLSPVAYGSSMQNEFRNGANTITLIGNNNNFGEGANNISVLNANLSCCEFASGASYFTIIGTSTTHSLIGFKMLVKNTISVYIDINVLLALDYAVVDMIDANGILWYKTVDLLGNMTTVSIP